MERCSSIVRMPMHPYWVGLLCTWLNRCCVVFQSALFRYRRAQHEFLPHQLISFLLLVDSRLRSVLKILLINRKFLLGTGVTSKVCRVGSGLDFFLGKKGSDTQGSRVTQVEVVWGGKNGSPLVSSEVVPLTPHRNSTSKHCFANTTFERIQAQA